MRTPYDPETYYVGASGIAHALRECAPTEHYKVKAENLLSTHKHCKNCDPGGQPLRELRYLVENLTQKVDTLVKRVDTLEKGEESHEESHELTNSMR